MLQKTGSRAAAWEHKRRMAACGRHLLKSKKLAPALLTLLAFVWACPSRAQQPQVTTEDYARAEAMLPWNAVKLAFHLDVEPNWIDGSNRFWYRREDTAGKKFVLVDAASNDSQPAFEHGKLAKALGDAAGKSYEAGKLPFDSFT